MPDGSTKASDVTVEALIDIWDRLAKKLVNAGLPADRVANSLWVTAALYASDPAKKLSAAAQRMRGVDDSATTSESDRPSYRPRIVRVP